jgi:hypothetical protein
MHFTLKDFRDETVRQTLNRTVAIISPFSSALNFFLNAVLICYCSSQVGELRHIKKYTKYLDENRYNICKLFQFS